MAVAAIDAQTANMLLMTERYGLILIFWTVRHRGEYEECNGCCYHQYSTDDTYHGDGVCTTRKDLSHESCLLFGKKEQNAMFKRYCNVVTM